MAFPGCPESLGFPLPPLLEQCLDPEPDSVRASGCSGRQPWLTHCFRSPAMNGTWMPIHCWEGDPGQAKMADGLKWHAVLRPSTFVTGAICLAAGYCFSLAARGLEETRLAVTQEHRYLAKRFCCFGLVACVLSLINMAEGGRGSENLGDQLVYS